MTDAQNPTGAGGARSGFELGWLLCGGKVLASAERATTLRARTVGLLGRHGIDGAMLFPRTSSVHTAFMRFPIDVAFLDREMTILDMITMSPWRVSRPRVGSRHTVEAEAGTFESWGIGPGDQLEFRPAGSERPEVTVS